jgi:hypothetical protein
METYLVEVTLEHGELAAAAFVGVYRQLESLRKKNKDRATRQDSGFTLHLEGAMAEMAVAKWLGVHWPATVNTYTSQPDIPPNIDVKWRSVDTGLYIKPDCRDDEHFVMVTGYAPTFRIESWITGKEAKDFNLCRPGGGRDELHFVPKADLYPIEEFPRP